MVRSEFRRCTRGNFAIGVALLSPILLGLAGGAIDLYVFQNHRHQLQSTADAAVLAAATEAGLKGWTVDSAKQVVASVVSGNLSKKFAGVTFSYEVKVDEKARRVTLDLSQDHYGYFVLGYFTGSPQIAVQATARASGQATICIIVQSPNQFGAFQLYGASKINAPGCSAYSNSVDTKGVLVKDTSRLVTQFACSGGGYSGKTSAFTPLPLTDCPKLSDPLAARASLVDAETNKSTCKYNSLKVDGANKTLAPGTYCGGLEIENGAKVTFQPGIHVIKDGRMRLAKGASIVGDGVAFVFSGSKSILDLKNDTSIALSAPKDGPMAGILIYAQGDGKKARDFKIESKNAQKFVGTVYLPSDSLIIGGDKDGDGVCDPDIADDGSLIPAGAACISDVGAASSWTAIIADTVRVTAGSTLVLNSDYKGSDVPVPDGIGPNSGRTFLSN
ncbi:MAG: pilus assembly protein TadG-related protein [Mesorhizobium sp.]|nr:pilus assembly protein TadG-related protein [Mesorhizobium sp.]